MKKLFILFFVFTGLFSNAQIIDSTWIRNNYSKKEVYIPMRDGIRLFTSVYIPKSTTEKHPVLITRTPYSCQPYGEENFSDYWKSFNKIVEGPWYHGQWEMQDGTHHGNI